MSYFLLIFFIKKAEKIMKIYDLDDLLELDNYDFAKIININELIERTKLDIDLINKIYETFNITNTLDKLTMYQKLDYNFLNKHNDDLDWDYVSIYQMLNNQIYKKFINKLNWQYISKHQELNIDLIRQYQHLLYWPNIFRYQKLNMKYILEFKRYLDQDIDNYKIISKFQQLDLEFIEENIDKLDLNIISKYQKIDNIEFIEKYKDKLNLLDIFKNKNNNINDNYIKENTNIDDLINLLDYRKFNIMFLDENFDNIFINNIRKLISTQDLSDLFYYKYGDIFKKYKLNFIAKQNITPSFLKNNHIDLDDNIINILTNNLNLSNKTRLTLNLPLVFKKIIDNNIIHMFSNIDNFIFFNSQKMNLINYEYFINSNFRYPSIRKKYIKAKTILINKLNKYEYYKEY